MATHQNYPQGPQATFVSVPLLNNSSQSEKERINKLFPIKTILGLSIAQLIFAGLGAATQVILIADEDYCGVHGITTNDGAGLWTGYFFAIAGGAGLVASKRPSNCTVTAFTVLSIIAALFALPLIIFSGIGVVDNGYRYRPKTDSWYRISNITCKFMSGIQMLTALAQGIVSITTAAFCCRVTCSPHRQGQTNVAFTY